MARVKEVLMRCYGEILASLYLYHTTAQGSTRLFVPARVLVDSFGISVTRHAISGLVGRWFRSPRQLCTGKESSLHEVRDEGETYIIANMSSH